MRRVVIVAVVLLWGVNDINASTGVLEIQNYVDSTIGTSPLDLCHYEDSYGATDENDPLWDVGVILPTSNRCSLYSDIGTHKLRTDCRSISSTADFLVQLVYNGNLSSATPNRLEFSLPYGADWEFGNKPIIFQSDLLPYGTVVDVRRAIAENGGIVQLKDLPAGNYNPNTPYGSGILTIGTRILGDTNDSGRVDLRDYTHIAADYGKNPAEGPFVGDISGPNGVPDGNVGILDVKTYSEDYLKDANDPNTW